ncbi:DLW-39 family protein [Ruania halotolerans]|nr:DLW-39 family protein [Ruania halotolerans]UFU06543.1 DLW-39 family protein [Ruania halotolerans]
MKKTVVLLVLAVGGFVAWRKLAEDRAVRDAWAEVTDPLD